MAVVFRTFRHGRVPFLFLRLAVILLDFLHVRQ